MNDHDTAAAADLTCPEDRAAAERIAGAAPSGASVPTAAIAAPAVRATLVDVEENGDAATMTLSLTMASADGQGTSTSMPVSIPLQRSDEGQWLVCGLTGAGLVPGGAGLPSDGAMPTGVLPSDLDLPSGLPTAPVDPSVVTSPPLGALDPEVDTPGQSTSLDRSDPEAVAQAWADRVNSYDRTAINELMCHESQVPESLITQMKAYGTTVEVLGVHAGGSVGAISIIIHNAPDEDGPVEDAESMPMRKDSGVWTVCPD